MSRKGRTFLTKDEKATSMSSLIKAVSAAYDEGLNRDEVLAICGAAWGDWYPAQEEQQATEAERSLFQRSDLKIIEDLEN